MASELAIYYTPMHFMWGVKSGATPASCYDRPASDNDKPGRVTDKPGSVTDRPLS